MKKIISLFILIITIIGCTNPDAKKNQLLKLEKLQTESDSLRAIIDEYNATPKHQIATFLTFQKENAEQAMNFYVELFDNSEIIELKKWGENAPGKAGTVMQGIFSLNGKLFMCSDSPPIHEWDFTPAVSNFVECDNENELEHLFTKLSENGQVTMPLNNYGFSQKFGWVIDQFGISWQLNLD